MKGVVDFLLVGRTPLGSSIRGVLVAVLVMLFWAMILDQFWTLVVVSLITALAIVVAAHLFSKRDNPATLPVEPGGPGLH
jgi:hypothetical protein